MAGTIGSSSWLPWLCHTWAGSWLTCRALHKCFSCTKSSQAVAVQSEVKIGTGAAAMPYASSRKALPLTAEMPHRRQQQRLTSNWDNSLLVAAGAHRRQQRIQLSEELNGTGQRRRSSQQDGSLGLL